MPVDGIVIGEIVRAHGIKGWVRVRATGATLDGIAVGEHVEVTGRDGAGVRDVLGVDGVPPRMLLLLSGVTDRTGAEALAGAVIRVPRARLDTELDDDTFYVTDLLGFTVVIGDRMVGIVREVQTGRGNDLLEVGSDEGGREGVVLVPFTHDAITDLDTAARRITVRGDLL